MTQYEEYRKALEGASPMIAECLLQEASEKLGALAARSLQAFRESWEGGV